jgi:EpsD family peptidyl-prolyl cis-trans isomerase
LGLALVVLIAGPACTRHEPDGTGQVAARVNGSEITVHQLNFLLANPDTASPDAGAEAGAVAPKDALERLVDQELLVQAAKARELDRQPDVLAAMEAARRNVLARAFLEQVDASVTPPGTADIHAYFIANPALFAERRVYTLREIRTSAPGGAADLQAAWERTHSWEALLEAVRAEGPRPERGTRVLAAEQLPLDAVPEFQRLREGEVRFTRLADGELAQQVVHIEREPMSEDAAAPLIAAYLTAQRRRAAERDALAALKASARIDRIGDFEAAQPTPAKGAGQ